MRQDWKTTWNDSQQNPLKVRAELVAGFRLAQPAQLDLAGILSTSAERWGAEGRRRYAAILAAAMRKIAADPEGPLRQLRDELLPGLRSFHIQHARVDFSPDECEKACTYQTLLELSLRRNTSTFRNFEIPCGISGSSSPSRILPSIFSFAPLDRAVLRLKYPVRRRSARTPRQFDWLP